MGSRALTPTMRSPGEELKPRAGWGNFLAFRMCANWSVLSGLQRGQKNEQRNKGPDLFCLGKHHEQRGGHGRWAGVCTEDAHGRARGPVGSDSRASPQPLPLLHVAAGRAVGGTGLSPSRSPSGRLGGRAAAEMAEGFDTTPQGSCEWVCSPIKERGKQEA